ncbi:putative DNA modification/repair radical SAM protein [Ornithobacterium rhinotracheale]|uniref:Putative DNA modification/repair radical SAM protein n=1 Tax=Ornithobacterium rhinotracheale (strain ATCC 51463 / DSM 15997 / CCUG 23171 / CIP 104009 / LMG 9086) TaxID=867902 RepID=I4A3A8_ORNRL|nr:putative DNA modification/repair radical SAM protein [Ornithobacterium rhinotracheale]AFL98442.1 putative DNA modification/repair radical SAM protein [Ornithobacterium rhinotracheale DSM 15997]AIQ00173.1 DNA modification/repair radical SAM protein [Ornithobacterium rhinotracheale ORT-UMN 88]KGB65761.1 DNA modification/repair radical SAM protein [Ornithobacterium rhinotracheale H06-030791]MBN3662869.1 putative DNA modification/repair radical SAM protein [Ornithobacterium rhinotracheale]MCK01
MNFDRIKEKLEILADAAKYDVSCSSSGGNRKNKGGLGNSHASGICHSFTEDGRCISLLKILLTNHCIYDCAYCVSRRSNDIKRAAFTVDEVVDLTMNFYRRNYIEGLFLSSGIFKNGDTTMERLVRIAKKLRTEHKFNGYIHLKSIPGASEELMREAGLYADRLSVNLEIPTEQGLKLLAPEKSHKDLVKPMRTIKQNLEIYKSERKIIKSTPKFAPAGQSTQMIVGATNETDLKIIHVANYFYKKYDMRRVYYSGYVPVLEDNRLPSLNTQVPVQREHRLYQADWLMRFYGFEANEILDSEAPFLDLEIDPKLAWAIRHRALFPVNINTAPKELLLRIPGVGVKSVLKILKARKFQKLTIEHLKKMGVATNRAKFFIEGASPNRFNQFLEKQNLRQLLLNETKSKWSSLYGEQLSLF